MINKTVSLFSLSFLAFSFLFNISHASPLVVDLNKNNLNLDWSAMTEAQTYTLYVALGDFKGDIDVTTLASVEMGHTTNLYVPGIPSGLIIYAAVLGHASEKNIVSNVVRFMPFAGTITYPESGDVLMQVEDPGGIGTIAVHGTRSNDGKDVSITQISGDDGTDAYALYITDDKPVAYSREGMTVYFMYHADGSIGLHTVDEELLIKPDVLTRATLPTEPNIYCTDYETRDDFEKALPALPKFREYIEDIRENSIYVYYEFEAELSIVLMMLIFENDPENYIHDPKYKLLEDYLRLIKIAHIDLEDELSYIYLRAYDKQCGKAQITYEYGACPVPSGAEYNSYIEDNELTEYYTLNGHFVGPFKDWFDTTRTDNELTACYDVDGKLHNTRYILYESGTKRMELYDHGIILQITDGYPGGNFKSISHYINGEMIEWISFYDHPGRYRQWVRYKQGLLDGWQERWYDNGYKSHKHFYENGKKEGEWYQYHKDNGKLSVRGSYANDLKTGEWIFYKDDGATVDHICTYENGNLIKCVY